MSEFPITGTAVSAITRKIWSLGVIFQSLDGRLGFIRRDGSWKPSERLTATPVGASPVASVTFHAGKEVSVSPCLW
jgi:hypothetical protein